MSSHLTDEERKRGERLFAGRKAALWFTEADVEAIAARVAAESRKVALREVERVVDAGVLPIGASAFKDGWFLRDQQIKSAVRDLRTEADR